MRYLVTGSTGVVGKYLVEELLDNPTQHNVEQIATVSRSHRYSYDDQPDKTNPILLECYGDLRLNTIRLISQFKPDVILHCAGEGRQSSPSKDIWKANVDTTLNLLESCKVLDKVKFVYCSSLAVNNNLLNFYGASKIAAETLLLSYTNMYDNLEASVCRFPAVVGAGNKHGVLKDIVAKLLDKFSPFKMKLFGKDPGSIKPFVYAGELASDLLYVANEHKSKYSVWNLSPLDNISVKSIAELAMNRVQYKKEIIWNNEIGLEDQQFVLYEKSDFLMFSSMQAIQLALVDILKEDHNYEH